MLMPSSPNDAGVLHRLVTHVEADDLVERQHMRAAQVKVRVRRGKPVEVCAADGGEQQRIGLCRDGAVEARVNGRMHWGVSQFAVSNTKPLLPCA